MDFTLFYEEQNNLLKNISLKFKRSIYNKIDLSDKLTAILGQRGVGKTTILLQKIKELKNPNILYISLDNPYFYNVSLYEFAKDFEKMGGEMLFIDEFHKYKDIAIHIKSIYDSTSLKVVLSGSSLLQIYKQQADLSRRINIIKIPILSFREYLEIKGIKFNSFSLDEIINNHFEITSKISSEIKPIKYFKEYLEFGCYPFVLENKLNYQQKLINIINNIIEVDLPYISNISYANIDKIKRLLYLISISVPFTPNINELSQKTNISRPSLLEYIYLLEKSELLINLHFVSRGYSKLQKPDKIYLNNTNLMKAITHKSDIGNERETFFVNQIKSYFLNEVSLFDESILLAKSGDFIVKDYTFEIGGKNKTKKQIKDIENSFVVADDIEVGFANKIPLWLFGFLY